LPRVAHSGYTLGIDSKLPVARAPQYLGQPQAIPSQGAGQAAAAVVRKVRPRGVLLFLYVMWCIDVLGPQWFIASLGPQFVLRIPTLLFGILLLVTLARGPRHLYPAFLTFLLYTAFIVPFAYIRTEALGVLKIVFAYYVIALATLTLVRKAREIVPIILLVMAVQYGVWVVLGARTGQITWHYTYFNYDSFGPLMVLGLIFLYWVGMATSNRKWRRIAFLTAGGCIVGLVVSFARGAVLSCGVVAVWTWYRSPNKVRTGVLGLAAAIVLIISATIFEGAKSAVVSGKAYTNFWQEMASSFDPNEGTRQDREVLWHLALRVYAHYPLFGVGPNCFGAYAADNFTAGTVGGNYAANPKTLYGRALHNTYYQLLSEFGTVGLALFGWLVWDFFKRNRQLRKQARLQAWVARTGGQLNLRYLSFGLEGAMMVFLLTAYFYNQIFDVDWFYSILTINIVLYHVTKPDFGAARLVPTRNAGLAR